MHSLRKKKIQQISIQKLAKLIDYNKYVFFSEYFNKLKIIKKIIQNISETREKRCNFKDFKCKLNLTEKGLFQFSSGFYFNPLLLYDEIHCRLDYLKSIEIPLDIICENCLDKLKNEYCSLFSILNDLTLFQEYQIYKKSNEKSNNASKFYELLLFNYISNNKRKDSPIHNEIDSNDRVIDSYTVGKYNVFQILIFQVNKEPEKKYIIKLSFDSTSERTFFRKTVDMVFRNLKTFEFDDIIPLEELIKIYKDESERIVNSNYSFTTTEKNTISYYASLKKLNIEKLFPLLIDDYIEEIFLDNPRDSIYLNHQKFGRCRTNIILDLVEIERLKTFLRLYSGLRLDYSNPSIKHVIKNKYFYCRFAIDVSPINFNKFAMDIRKLNKNILTIQDLLKYDTINPLMASFLYFCIIRRVNITVTGETDTGKTTLINAFDLLTPKEFRKIYIENVVESLNQISFNKHQLKYKVDSLDDSSNKKYSKSNHIKTLLHRSPDLIYLGEILTKEEAEAMFHCLAAGLKGFQTIHSNDVDSLLNRFLYHFTIEQSCLNDLNLIILMKKTRNNRKIISINEIDLDDQNSNRLYRTIFKFSPKNNSWENLWPLYETNTINKIREFEYLNLENFTNIINTYYDIFTSISQMEPIENKEIVDLFHRISYYSLESEQDLLEIWNSWKNKRGLNL
jgi:flagellar protein FlaI